MELFPSRYIGVGGDECVKDQWQADAPTQRLIRRLGLADEDALQSWYFHRLGDHLARHGRRLLGWDEIREGSPPPGRQSPPGGASPAPSQPPGPATM
jgi:hexosaminidase